MLSYVTMVTTNILDYLRYAKMKSSMKIATTLRIIINFILLFNYTTFSTSYKHLTRTCLKPFSNTTYDLVSKAVNQCSVASIRPWS